MYRGGCRIRERGVLVLPRPLFVATPPFSGLVGRYLEFVSYSLASLRAI